MNRHDQKLKIVRKIITRAEQGRGVTPFGLEAWRKRKDAIKSRVFKRQKVAHKRAVERGDHENI